MFMYEITVTRTFCAAHAIRLHDGVLEPLHGHNWQVTITVAAENLDPIETVMDFHDLERRLDAQLAPVNNHNLNDCAPFSDGRGGLAVNPTAERVAWWLATAMASGLPPRVKLISAAVTEAPGCVARYRP